MIDKFFEYVTQKDFEPIKSFYLQNTLNPKIWHNFKIDDEIRESLLKIANDYVEHLELEDTEIDDIMLTGSNSNYNWSEYSDFDLHIIFDFEKINEDTTLVKKYLQTASKLWNEEHDLLIKGYEVEVYAQDINEPHVSSGEFSLLNNKWIKKPSKEDFEPDEELIKRKAGVLMDRIDDLEIDFKYHFNYKDLSEKVKKLWKKIKGNRQKGLYKEGEFSIENLVFKLMRRNGYIGKLISLKSKIYDKQFK